MSAPVWFGLPPQLPAGPGFAVTAGLTAWSGPWGVNYAANLTPDENTGLGIWTEEMFLKTMRIALSEILKPATFSTWP